MPSRILLTCTELKGHWR